MNIKKCSIKVESISNVRIIIVSTYTTHQLIAAKAKVMVSLIM